MHTPRNTPVAIISPCYNAAAFIPHTWETLLHQSRQDFIWIVTDDASTDNSVALLQEITQKDDRLILIQNEQNQGAAVSRNRCIEAALAQGCTYLAFLDIDDYWKPAKLETSIRFLEENNAHFSFHSYQKGKNGSGSIIHAPEIVTYDSIVRTNSVPTSTVVLRAEIVGDTRMRNELRWNQDYVFWMDLLRKGYKAYGFDEALTIYNVGHKSLSSNKLNKALRQWRILRDYTEFGLFARLRFFFVYMFFGTFKYLK